MTPPAETTTLADMTCPFLDDETMNSVQWAEIWRQFTPVTPYGVRWKRDAKPFLPGQGEQAQQAASKLRNDIALWRDEAVASWQEKLSVLPDIDEALATLRESDTALSPKQLLALKSFAYHGLRLASAEERVVQLAQTAWTQPSRWRLLLELFGEPDTPSFSVQHIADEEYREVSQNHAQAMQRLAMETRQRDAAWFELAGVPPHRDGHLSLPLPEARRLATKLKDLGQIESHTGNENSVEAAEAIGAPMSDIPLRCRWVRDTPFESVFEVSPTPPMVYWGAVEKKTRQQLDDLQDRLIANLCQHLRAVLPEWNQSVNDVTNIDIRLAKVSLAFTWNGVAPEFVDDPIKQVGKEFGQETDKELAKEIFLHRAVHPLVSARLRDCGKVYVPLTLSPQFGANVLCGSNMGGKTVAMRLLVISQALAQYGLPVPAECFRTVLFRHVRFIGTADTDLFSGLSSFGHEVEELTRVWNQCFERGRTLVCFDEPGRSTNPHEGEALVIGLLQGVQDRSDRQLDGAWQHVVLVASHFAGVFQLPNVRKFRVRGLRRAGVSSPHLLPSHRGEAYDEHTTRRIAMLEQWMDYEVELVTEADIPFEAHAVARWLGLPDAILKHSEEYLRARRADAAPKSIQSPRGEDEP